MTVTTPTRLVRRLCWVGLVASLLLTGALTYRYLSERAGLEAAAFASAQAQARAATDEINRVFGGLMVVGELLANDLTTGGLAYADLEARLLAEAERRPDIDGFAVTFEPFVYDPDERLYQVYVSRTAEGAVDVLRGATYDYTVKREPGGDGPNTDWYHGPLEHGALWNEPFLATGAGKVLVEYGAPFRRSEASGGGGTAGVVTVDYSLAGMRDLLNALDLGATGYGMVVSSSGVLLAHPVSAWVATESVFDLADAAGSPALREVAERALAGESFALESLDSLTGQTSWFFAEPINATGWSLILVLNTAEFAPDARVTLRDQAAIALSGAACVYLGALLALRVERGARPRLWLASNLFALLSLALIVMIARLYMAVQPNHAVRITDAAALDRYLQAHQQRSAATSQPPMRIPTGVYIQALDFPDPTSAQLNGYVWQYYPDSVGDDVVRGVVFPQRTGPEATFDEVLRMRQGDGEVIVWYFGMIFKQRFDPARFPFDSRDIALRLAAADVSANLVLVPDLRAYEFIAPLLLPGVDREAALNNWTMAGSLYSYITGEVNATTLGLDVRQERAAAPELAFNIQMQRNSLGPFIAYLLPGAIAAFLLFGFLLNDLQPGESDEISDTLNFVAAMFFVLVLAQTALRENIAAVGLTYLEFFYLLLYAAIMAVAINTYLVVNQSRAWVVRLGNDIVPKLLYWPALTGVMLLVTLAIFVYS